MLAIFIASLVIILLLEYRGKKQQKEFDSFQEYIELTTYMKPPKK